MSMLCPRCGNTFEQRLDCDLCGVRLVLYDARRARRPRLAAVRRWRQTTAGRILVGLFLAQGLFYGLRQLLTGALMAAQGQTVPEAAWQTQTGHALYLGLRFASVFAAAAVAGSGRRLGMVLGAVVGAGSGVLATLLRPAGAPVLTPTDLIVLPLAHTAVGLLAGWFGCLFWKPLPLIDPRGNQTNAKRPRAPSLLFAGPLAWVRVTLGVTLAVTGSLAATRVFDLTLDFSGGRLATNDDLQDQVVTWEIRAVAMIVGGVLAGATRRNGIKQGLAVGLATSIILVGAMMARYNHWPMLAVWTVLSALPLGLAGGYFGCQLFPPIVKLQRLRDLGPV
jgi:hypothetical protein